MNARICKLKSSWSTCDRLRVAMLEIALIDGGCIDGQNSSSHAAFCADAHQHISVSFHGFAPVEEVLQGLCLVL